MNYYRLKACGKCGGDLAWDQGDWICLQCGTYYYVGLYRPAGLRVDLPAVMPPELYRPPESAGPGSAREGAEKSVGGRPARPGCGYDYPGAVWPLGWPVYRVAVR